MTTKSNHYCCVPQCDSRAKKDVEKTLSFHRFPPENVHKVWYETAIGRELIDRKKAWTLRLRIKKPVNDHMRVCSRHFTGSDYVSRGKRTANGRILKKNAVPSQNLPTPTPSTNRTERSERYKRKYQNLESQPPCEEDISAVEFHSDKKDHSEEDIHAAERLLAILRSNPNPTEGDIEVSKISMQDAAVQVNTDRISTLSDLIQTDSALKSFTGINNFKIFDCIVEMSEQVYHDTRVHKLSIKDRILLTMVKLKLDLTYVTLGMLFNISSQLCKTYFFEFLTVLNEVLEPCIYFPSSEEISKNMPKCFKNFKDCRIVLDCTEIILQKPSCLCCRIRFYSQYKKNITVKFMTGVSPAGTITFISKAYGGRASDKLIFEESNLITQLNPNRDSIMVDKGFLIEDICAMFRIKLYRPPFLRKSKQLTAEESIKNQEIASARVHIERSNQRLKIFKILNGTLQWTLVHKIDEIFTIICGITNLSSSILSDERFI